MSIASFRARVRANEPLSGTFMKTPSVDVLEVLILAGLDFVCLDGEHAAFDRSAMNPILAVARAADFPVLVRVPSSAPEHILGALDLGAVGVVVPHVLDPEIARSVARSARFGAGGRGYAGSTRWAGFATRPMPEVLAQSQDETVVIAQIEDVEAVEQVEDIAATDGIDALFLGPADLTVGYGHTSIDNPDLQAATTRVQAAAHANGKAYMTFAANLDQVRALRPQGFGAFFVASEQAWMIQGARAVAEGIAALE